MYSSAADPELEALQPEEDDLQQVPMRPLARRGLMIVAGTVCLGIAAGALIKSRSSRTTVSSEEEGFIHEWHIDYYGCAEAENGSDCFNNITWAMKTGIFQHPEWYHGLTQWSSRQKFQDMLHRSDVGGCKRPCEDRLPDDCGIPPPGSECAQKVAWARTHGITEKPGFYPGLNRWSSFQMFQDTLHRAGEGHCPPACEGGLPLDYAREKFKELRKAVERHHPIFMKAKLSTQDMMQWQVRHDCPPQRVGMEFVGSAAELTELEFVQTAAHCQKECTENDGCHAWNFLAANATSGTCYLRRKEDAAVRRHNSAMMSGTRCNTDEVQKAPWPANHLQEFNLSYLVPPPTPAAAPASLLCVAMVRPYTYEVGLISMVKERNMSIFHSACDLSVVYSSQLLEILPGLVTRRIESTQMCEVGGQFMSAMNLGIFMAYYRQLLLDRDYLKVNWIVKVDPDSVFFADRLKQLLPQYENNGYGLSGDGTLLNNCKLGLHGPIETFSRNALQALGRQSWTCANMFNDLCKGPPPLIDCEWGEDMWVDQCFIRKTGTQRPFVWQLLVEEHCQPFPGWRDCKDWQRVTFHPFKSKDDYEGCLDRALAGAKK